MLFKHSSVTCVLSPRYASSKLSICTMFYQTIYGDFSFDALFGNLVKELLPSYQKANIDSAKGHISSLANLSNRNLRTYARKSTPMFPEVDALLSLFKNSYTQLTDLRKQIGEKLYNLQKEVAIQDSKHRKALGEASLSGDLCFNLFEIATPP